MAVLVMAAVLVVVSMVVLVGSIVAWLRFTPAAEFTREQESFAADCITAMTRRAITLRIRHVPIDSR
jgi:hypothetical protein